MTVLTRALVPKLGANFGSRCWVRRVATLAADGEQQTGIVLSFSSMKAVLWRRPPTKAAARVVSSRRRVIEVTRVIARISRQSQKQRHRAK